MVANDIYFLCTWQTRNYLNLSKSICLTAWLFIISELCLIQGRKAGHPSAPYDVGKHLSSRASLGPDVTPPSSANMRTVYHPYINATTWDSARGIVKAQLPPPALHKHRGGGMNCPPIRATTLFSCRSIKYKINIFCTFLPSPLSIFVPSNQTLRRY